MFCPGTCLCFVAFAVDTRWEFCHVQHFPSSLCTPNVSLTCRHCGSIYFFYFCCRFKNFTARICNLQKTHARCAYSAYPSSHLEHSKNRNQTVLGGHNRLSPPSILILNTPKFVCVGSHHTNGASDAKSHQSQYFTLLSSYYTVMTLFTFWIIKNVNITTK